MKDKSNNASIMVVFVVWVQLLFVFLQLLKVIAWSWWQVLIPLWTCIALIGLALLSGIIVSLIERKEK